MNLILHFSSCRTSENLIFFDKPKFFSFQKNQKERGWWEWWLIMIHYKWMSHHHTESHWSSLRSTFWNIEKNRKHEIIKKMKNLGDPVKSPADKKSYRLVPIYRKFEFTERSLERPEQFQIGPGQYCFCPGIIGESRK